MSAQEKIKSMIDENKVMYEDDDAMMSICTMKN